MTRASSNARYPGRFIPSEEVGEVVHWTFSSVGDEVIAPVAPEVPELPSPADEEAREREQQLARDDAFEQGKAQGAAEAALQWQQKLDDYIAGEGAAAAQQFAQLAKNFEQGLEQAQQSVAQGVLALACDVARQVVRRELRDDHLALQPVIAEALQDLTTDNRPITVRLHPDDERAFGADLREAFADHTVQWIADSDVLQGGCRVEQAGKLVDGTLEKRWQRAIAALGLDAPFHEEDGNGAE